MVNHVLVDSDRAAFVGQLHQLVQIGARRDQSRNSIPSRANLTNVRLKVTLRGRSGPVEFTANRGEIVGIAGIQGQGQSELVRQLFGVEGPITMEIDGKRVVITNPRTAVRNGVAFISGDREREGTFSHHSIRLNASTVSRFVLGKRQSLFARVLSDLHTVYKTPNQKIRELSGGNQQKVVLARWISTAPRVVLADDPTKGIDVLARRDVHESFTHLAQGGTTIIVVSSDEEELVALHQWHANMRVIVMYQGIVLRELTGDQITIETLIEASIPRGGYQCGIGSKPLQSGDNLVLSRPSSFS